MERENGRWDVMWSAAAGLALVGGLLLSTHRPVDVRDSNALPRVPEVRAEAVHVADGIPFPTTIPKTRVADGIPFPTTIPKTRVADGIPFPTVRVA